MFDFDMFLDRLLIKESATTSIKWAGEALSCRGTVLAGSVKSQNGGSGKCFLTNFANWSDSIFVIYGDVCLPASKIF